MSAAEGCTPVAVAAVAAVAAAVAAAVVAVAAVFPAALSILASHAFGLSQSTAAGAARLSAYSSSACCRSEPRSNDEALRLTNRRSAVLSARPPLYRGIPSDRSRTLRHTAATSAHRSSSCRALQRPPPPPLFGIAAPPATTAAAPPAAPDPLTASLAICSTFSSTLKSAAASSAAASCAARHATVSVSARSAAERVRAACTHEGKSCSNAGASTSDAGSHGASRPMRESATTGASAPACPSSAVSAPWQSWSSLGACTASTPRTLSPRALWSSESGSASSARSSAIRRRATPSSVGKSSKSGRNECHPSGQSARSSCGAQTT
eukprot:6201649-Pleurochrysis_carterae.AAC.1